MHDTSKINANILIVDDVPENLTILTNILTERGYTVRPAINGQIALKAARHVPPDLILLDIMMPGMDGYEVCRQLKADKQTCDIPVLFISALDETWNKIKAFECGGIDYVTKPFETREVAARVEIHITLRRMQQQLQEQNIQLQQEIRERTRMESALRQYNRELAILNTMSSLLQTCQRESDMDRIIVSSCEQLFPTNSGYIALIDDTGTALQQRCTWGGYPVINRAFLLQDYPLLTSDTLVEDEQQRARELGAQLETITDSSKHCFAITVSTAESVLGIFVIILQHNESAQSSETKWMMANGVVEHYSLALANVRLREALRLEAIRDPLTDLFNRRYMEEALLREARRAHRNHTEIGIIMLDIDHFKILNDTYGHEAGDIVLQHLGALLLKMVRGGDIACRYGGEEFLLILPDFSSSAVEQRAQNLLKQIRALRIPYQGEELTVTVSMGVAIFPEHGTDVQEIVSIADRTLYQAKHAGRNQIMIAPL